MESLTLLRGRGNAGVVSLLEVFIVTIVFTGVGCGNGVGRFKV